MVGAGPHGRISTHSVVYNLVEVVNATGGHAKNESVPPASQPLLEHRASDISEKCTRDAKIVPSVLQPSLCLIHSPMSTHRITMARLYYVLVCLLILTTFIEQRNCWSIEPRDHLDLSGKESQSEVRYEAQHSSRSGNTEALKIEFIEYIVLGVIVLFLLALLFVLRYMMKLKQRCPHYCCGWFPSPELRHEKQYPNAAFHHSDDDLQRSKVDVEPSNVEQQSNERNDQHH